MHQEASQVAREALEERKQGEEYQSHVSKVGSKQFFVLVRHSQRADDPTMSWEMKRKQQEVIIEQDPQLSRPTGKEQAQTTAQYLRDVLTEHHLVGDLAEAEIFLFSSPFLVCVETAAAIAKGLQVSKISVMDALCDILMKAWYSEDPFHGLAVKLTTNKEPFLNFLRQQYDAPDLEIDYKRAASTVKYPETVDQTTKRFRQFYKSLVEKYFTLEQGQYLDRSRIIVCVTHGVAAHNPFLHLFEADKDVVYLDYSAVTIVEKALLTYNRAAPQTSNIAEALRANEDDENAEMRDSNVLAACNPASVVSQSASPVKASAAVGNAAGQSWSWEVRQFGDASHIPDLGVAML